MSNINIFFILQDPNGVPQRIQAGDLGKESEDWTMDMLMSDTYYKNFTRISDKIAQAPISKEYQLNSPSYTILGDGWVEVAVEATSIEMALFHLSLERKKHNV